MKFIWSSLVIALVATLAAPVSSDELLDQLVAAGKTGSQEKIDRIMEKCLNKDIETSAMTQKVKDLISQAEAAGENGKKPFEEAIQAMAALLLLRADVTVMINDLLPVLDKAPTSASAALERAFCIRSCHGLRDAEMKKEGLDPSKWASRKQAWKLWWDKNKDKTHVQLLFDGFKRAGLKLPPPSQKPADLDAGLAEFIKGLDHEDFFVRFQSYDFLSVMIQDRQFDYDVDADKAVRDKVANEMRNHLKTAKAKATAHKVFKEIITIHASGK